MTEETKEPKLAKIIAVVNQKGGSGKTTVSMQLAGTLGTKGYEVAVVDADPQATATTWSSQAPDDSPFPSSVFNLSAAGGKIHLEVKKLIEKYDFIIIDCPPSVESVIPQSALLIADLALIPVIPALGDAWATKGMEELIERVKGVRPDLEAKLLINQLQPNTNIAQTMSQFLHDGFKIQPCQTTFGFRTAYKESQAGITVHDLGMHKAEAAIGEVLRLTDEVLTILRLK
jgi:chromosome partitioning protein